MLKQFQLEINVLYKRFLSQVEPVASQVKMLISVIPLNVKIN